MERLTRNKPIPDMSMLELAYNSCYVDKERKARYRDYELDIDSRELVKDLVEDMCDAIFMLPGWQESKGCNMEFEYAYEHGIHIVFASGRG